MNPIILSFTDGTSFFVGLVIVLLAEVMLTSLSSRLARRVLTLLAITGIMLVLISATPLPVWVYILWMIPAVGGLVLASRADAPRSGRLVAGGVLVIFTAGLSIAELPYHHTPRPKVRRGATVYVIGDSMSAGMGTPAERCWPEVLQDLSGLHIVNMALAGATVDSAMAQTKGITEPGALVIVEIGGNDLLGHTDASEFGAGLDALVSSLHSGGHPVLLMELPLPPFRNAFGQAQRNVASRYGAMILPKRCFTTVLATRNATLDGLHLSQEGHNAMAKIMADVIERQ